jgi:hypothetical protein
LEEITHTSDGVKGFGDEREYEREGDGGKGASVEVR